MTTKLVEKGCLAVATCWIALATPTLDAAADTVPDRWAVVKTDGTLVRSQGALSSSMLSEGVYEVEFRSGIADCVYQATLGNAATPYRKVPIGKISVAPTGARVLNRLRVVTRNSDGALTRAGFHVLVSCLGTSHTDADRWAFVTQFPEVVRGRGAVTAHSLAPGSIDVIFDKDVSQCAYLASSREGAPQISVAPRLDNPKGVFVRITGRTGESSDAALFLVVKCPPRSADVLSARAWSVVNADGTLARDFRAGTSERIQAG